MWGGNLNDSIQDTTGEFLNDSRSSTSGNKESVKRGERIIPVMIQHLTQPYDVSSRIITFIGIVRYIGQTNTKITYKIEDETGSITAFQWLEAKKTITESVLNLNTYVRVYGHIREQNENKHVLIIRIWPLTDLNELTNHLLEITYVMLKIEKMNNTKNESSNAMKANDMSDDNINGLTKEQALVFKIIQAENYSEDGLERDILKARAPKTVLPNIDDIIDFLISEGHIYTTLTDNHFKTT